MTAKSAMQRAGRESLIGEVLATLDEHLDGVTTADEAASLIATALRRHAAQRTEPRPRRPRSE